MSSRLLSALVLACVSLLVLGGCGKAPKKEATPTPSASLPTGNVQVPDGVTLTAPGTNLDFGEKATVAYEPNPQRSSVLELSVLSARRGSIQDLSMYTLDDRTRASVPYYVRVSVANVGNGDVGRTAVPLWAVDGNDTLIQASSFTNTFGKCPSKALPESFAPSDKLTTCLVYLVPEHGNLVGVSFRPLQAFEPIEWTGKVATP